MVLSRTSYLISSVGRDAVTGANTEALGLLTGARYERNLHSMHLNADPRSHMRSLEARCVDARSAPSVPCYHARHQRWDELLKEVFFASSSIIHASTQEFLEVLKDESFMEGDRELLTSFFRERGPWVGHCKEPHCTQCHYEPTRRDGGRRGEGRAGSSSSSGSSGASASGSGSDEEDSSEESDCMVGCPVERMSRNVSVAIQLLVPLLVRGVLRAERQDPVDRTLGAYTTMGAVTLMCMRVLSESHARPPPPQQQQQQQQQQSKSAPSGAGTSDAGMGQASSGGSTGGVAAAAVGDDAAPCGVQGPHAYQEVRSWRELLLSLRPFTLLRLAMMKQVEGAMDPPVCALWALALALPEEFAAALQHDPELMACIARRVKGWEGSEPDGSLVSTLQQVLPGLPPCKAVTALEGRCALPVVSRAKRQAAGERVVQLRPLWARARVLVDTEEVLVVLEGAAYRRDWDVPVYACGGDADGDGLQLP